MSHLIRLTEGKSKFLLGGANHHTWQKPISRLYPKVRFTMHILLVVSFLCLQLNSNQIISFILFIYSSPNFLLWPSLGKFTKDHIFWVDSVVGQKLR